MKDTWGPLAPKQWFGGLLTVVAIGLTFWVANAGDNAVLIAVFAAVAQFASAFLFAGHGKADPVHARRSIERLGVLARRADDAEKSATEALENDFKSAAMRRRMGEISVALSYIQEDAIESAKDWAAFNPQVKPDEDEEQT